MEYRGKDWINPYLQQDDSGDFVNSRVFEAGASAMGEHILSLLKEKARASVIIDILEMNVKIPSGK